MGLHFISISAALRSSQQSIQQVLHLESFYEKNGLEVENSSNADKDPAGNQTSHRISIDVRGSEISKYHEWIKHPEVWEREYKNLRSYNWLAQSFGSFGMNLTLLLIVIVIIIRSRKKDIRWKSAFTYGGLIALLIALWQLNRIPETLMWVDSSMSFGTMLFQKVFMDVILVSIIIRQIVLILVRRKKSYDESRLYIKFVNLFTAMALGPAIGVVIITSLFFNLEFKHDK